MKKSNESPHDLPFEAAKAEEVLPLLLSGVQRAARLQCWSAGRKHSYTSRILKVHETSGLVSISIAKDAEGAGFEAALSRASPNEILFSLHLPTDVIFFKGELRPGGADFFNARLKVPIFKVQRRDALRLPVPGGVPVLFKFASGRSAGAELVNVSSGGVAVTLRERADFETGRALIDTPETVTISFTAFGVVVSARATVRHVAEAGSTLVKKTFRLGLAFTEIDPRTQTLLSQLVFEESAKYLGRL